jgi:hypothetical protein
MSGLQLTDEQRREYRAQSVREYNERFACPACKGVDLGRNWVMDFVVMLQEGNGQGCGEVNLFQCPSCKHVATFDRSC